MEIFLFWRKIISKWVWKVDIFGVYIFFPLEESSLNALGIFFQPACRKGLRQQWSVVRVNLQDQILKVTDAVIQIFFSGWDLKYAFCVHLSGGGWGQGPFPAQFSNGKGWTLLQNSDEGNKY